MTRVVHIITGLAVGGAEVMLDRLLGALDRSRIQSEVICLAGEGPIAARIREKQIRVQALNLSSGISALAGIPRIVARLREVKPDVVHTWMYHADFLGGAAARLLGVPVVWSLHAGTVDPAQNARSTHWLIQVLAKLSSTVPNRIVSCSHVGRKAHEAVGYDASKMEFIPNGFDTAVFRRNDEFRRIARAQWVVGDHDIVIGHLARFHPQKDHRTLLEAAARCLREDPHLKFVLFGSDVNRANSVLAEQADQLGLGERCLLLGPNPAAHEALPGFDVLVSSSSSEAFPLVVGEAMACEIPCVVTDVGDSSFMVGPTGKTVAPRDPQGLSRALLEMARLDPFERQRLGAEARARVEANFSLTRVADLYAGVYEQLAGGAA